MLSFYRILPVFSLTILTIGSLAAQSPSQTLRGKIINAVTQQPLSNANVTLNANAKGVSSDSNGIYRFENLPVGRYRLQVSFVGFDTLVVPELLLESGRERVLDLPLQPAINAIEGIVVTAAPLELTSISPSVRSISNETTLRFPATFFDPARTAITFPGVVNSNDQANGLNIRGNSPNGMIWRLEGADIVNPNHTSNAGTFSDRISTSAGGVNMLSTQLLGNSAFYTGAFPVEYGNALSGVLDMRLRNGNNEKREYTLQAGLIGIDAAAEGPLGKPGKSSFLANYRYSTLGLLSAIGVDLGDEVTTYQDFSFNLNVPMANKSRLTFFGMGGTSSNIFKGKRDSSLWEFSKDRYDITFQSKAGVTGATYTAPVGTRGSWRTVVAASGLHTTRTADRLDSQYQLKLTENDAITQSKINVNSVLRYQISSRNSFRIGAQITRQSFDIISQDKGQTLASGSSTGFLLQPYAGWRSDLSSKFAIDGGIHYLRYNANGTDSWQPRLAFLYQADKNNRFSFAYGKHSQLQQPQLYFSRQENSSNQNLGFTKADHWVVSYLRKLGDLRTFEVQAYYQNLFGVPVSAQRSSSFSALNTIEGFVSEKLSNTGKGRNYGVEVNLQQYWTKGFYYLTNATVYKSEYAGSDNIWRNTRFNNSYVFNFTAGKEWQKPRSKNRIGILGINGRFTVVGGFRDTPIDLAASKKAGTTVYIESEAYSIQLPVYSRLDLRIYLKRNKTGRNNTLTLDLQNVTNHKNAAYNYFDAQKAAIVRRTQLGLIPILSYRVEF
jgi:hypothetical protein